MPAPSPCSCRSRCPLLLLSSPQNSSRSELTVVHGEQPPPTRRSSSSSQGQRPYSLSRQRSSSQPSFPHSPSTSTCRRCSTECPWEILCCTQQPRHLRALSARCCVKPSGQHAVDFHRWVAVFAQPQCHRRSPPVRPRRSLFDSASALFSYD